VPDAVLWLLGEAQSTPARQLREQAALAGVDPARVVFQPKLPHERYLALYRHVDLFLDTWPYGAHTTASDALWAGAPMLTYSGRTFAARVGTSLLHALGLPGMAVGNVDDYVARAIELGRDPHLLAAQREALARARAQSSVFDMRRFARHFERAVALMHERACAGLAPTDFDLPPA
jgi:predicted O-linked N-acetylglucosamine transferase (SPINDLY family)